MWCEGEPRKQMSNGTYNYAKHELDILIKSSKNKEDRPIIEPFIPELLALAKKFGNSENSGSETAAVVTATAISHAVKHLLLQEPICPVTGIDEEWMNFADEDGIPQFQNNRLHNLFKSGKNGKAYYLDAIAFKTQDGRTCTGFAELPNGEIITSRQYVKSFPFTAKTFYIDVMEEEPQPDWFEHYIKDTKQLDRVFKYYDKKEYTKK